MPEMRDDSGAEDSRHGRRRAKGNSFTGPQILERAPAHHSCAIYRDGARHSGRAYRFDHPKANREMDRVRPGDTGGSLGGRLFLHACLAVDRKSQPQHVYAHCHRCRRRLFLQRRGSGRAGDFSGFIPTQRRHRSLF